MRRLASILFLPISFLIGSAKGWAQNAGNDTIRLGAVEVNGATFPMVFLPEEEVKAAFMNAEEKNRRAKLRYDIYVAYPYALTASAILKDVNTDLAKMDRRHDRKTYLKTIDRKLDETFKQPLKDLTIDQGHVLIKLIDRQTGSNCYDIIRELKGGFSAVLWQSVGVLFNNNLRRDYDPNGEDREMENIVRDLEASNAYKYQFYRQQEALLKKAKHEPVK